MNELTRSVTILLAEVVPFALLVKVTLLLLAATGTTALMRDRAAARHLVWSLALIACAALALATPVLPPLTIGIEDVARPAVVGTSELATPAAPAGAGVPSTATTARGIEPTGASGAPASTDARSTITASRLAGLIWGAGFLMVMLWSAIGHAALYWLARRARLLSDPSWKHHLEHAGAADNVRLLASPSIGTPMTWGQRRPVVLLPEEAESWPTDRKRVVLLHELAHISRGDYVAQLIGTIACAVYWFHPLVWYAAGRLRIESERACDDLVLSRGVVPIEYATHLLEIAREMRAMRLIGPATVGMARRSQLEERLMAVLGSVRSRAGISARMRSTGIAMALMVVGPIAALRPELRLPNATPVPNTVRSTEPPPSTGTPSREIMAASATPRVAAVVPTTVKRSPVEEPAQATPPAPPVSQSPEFVDSVNVASGERLTLDLRTGATITVKGWDNNRVVVRGRLGGRDWDDTRVVLTRESGGARLRSQFRSDGQSSNHRFEIMVPKRFDVRLRSAGGGVTIADVEGSFAGNSGGGGLWLERVRGEADLSTGGGEIEVNDSHLTGQVTTGGGSVTFTRVTGGLRGSSGSGPVIFTEGGGKPPIVADEELNSRLKRASERARDALGDAEARDSDGETLTNVGGDDGPRLGDWPSAGFVGVRRAGRMHLSRAGGNVRLNDVPDGAVIRTGGGDIDVRGGQGVVDATTGGGDVDIGPIAGSVRATTGAGTVRIAITSAAGVTHHVEATSGKGRVIIELPANLDARFELETAYTARHDGKTRITSDWPLTESETADWDAREGTPRKYVRATGRAGSGRGLVRVRTVNGDVTIRRAGR